jgi:hypothetical protein
LNLAAEVLPDAADDCFAPVERRRGVVQELGGIGKTEPTFGISQWLTASNSAVSREAMIVLRDSCGRSCGAGSDWPRHANGSPAAKRNLNARISVLENTFANYYGGKPPIVRELRASANRPGPAVPREIAQNLLF